MERLTCGCSFIYSDSKRPPASPTWASVYDFLDLDPSIHFFLVLSSSALES